MHVTYLIVIVIQLVILFQVNGDVGTFPRLIKPEGDKAVLRCLSDSYITKNPIQWTHRAIGARYQDSSLVYFGFQLNHEYATGGRHNVSNDSLESCVLVITQLSLDDAGTYRCAYERTSDIDYSDIELTVIESPRCTPNISLDNVLIENECGLLPDFVGLTCSLRYRGNFAPVLQWRNSSKPEDVISTSQFQYQSNVVTSLNLSLKPEFHSNGMHYICSVKDIDMNIRGSVCKTEDIKVVYIFKPSTVFYPGRNDIVTITCIANASSRDCGYRWHVHNLSSNISFERVFENLQLDENMSDVRCVAQCKIRSKWCSVSSDIYSNIPYRLQELKSSDQESGSNKSGGGSTAVIVCSVILSILLVTILASVFILKRNIKKIEKMMRYSDQNQRTTSRRNDPLMHDKRAPQRPTSSKMKYWSNLALVYIAYWITLIIHFGNFHLIGAEIKTYPKELIKLEGDSAILQCISSSNPPGLLQWRYLKFDGSAHDVDVMIFDGEYMVEPFNEGRHNVTLKESPQSCNLNITGITMDDAGTYICASVDSTEHSDIELIVLESQPRCGSNISLDNVLVENDCNLTPDYIDLSCSVGYRGKIAPVLQWLHSEKPDIAIASSISQPQSKKITRLNHPIKPTYDMNGTYFICSFETAELGIRKRECATHTIMIDYIFRPYATISSSSADFVICIANTSSHACEYQWHGTGVPLNRSEHILQLDKTINNISCATECDIHGRKCLVTSPVFTQSSPVFTEDKPSSVWIIYVVVGIVGILMVVLLILLALFIRKRRKRSYIRRRSTDWMTHASASEMRSLKGFRQDSTIPETDHTQRFANYDSIDLKNCNPSDIIQGFVKVMRQGFELQDYIDPENGLLTALGNRGIIRDSEIRDMREIVPYQILNGELLTRIAINIDSISQQFIDALCENEQDHIAKFIVTSGCETNSDERLLPRELREVIEDNMFCLDKLLDAKKNDLFHWLVAEQCITPRHRERVIKSKPEDKAHELLIILQRRRYKDYFNFIDCLRKTMQKNIVKILENGGVTEVKIQLCHEHVEEMDIEETLIRKLTGYIDEGKTSGLSEDQRKIVDEILLSEFDKNGIHLVGTCTGTSKGSMSMFLQGESEDSLQVLKTSKGNMSIISQGEAEDSFQVLNDGCESPLKITLEKLFRSLLKIVNSSPLLIKEVTTGEHSIRHPVFERNAGCRSNLSKLRNEIHNVREQYHNKLTTKCYQLKIHRMMDHDFEKVIRNFHEHETVHPILDRFKLIEGQLRTLDLWETLQFVNPCPLIKFDRDELSKRDFASLENKEDLIFRRSIVLCSIFEDLMRTLSLKVGDTLDIEEDICDVVGQLLMRVEKQDRSRLLDCMQSAMMNIQVEDSKQDGDKLRTLLITKKKYNGLNLACVLLEQMILDNKDINVSWMRTVCTQFIDLVVQLIIEPDYRKDVHWTLTYLSKLESEWKVVDVYNLMKNGLLVFYSDQKKFLGYSEIRSNQEKFHRYLMIIRNFALHPTMNIRPSKKKKPFQLEDILYSRDKSKWRCLDEVDCGNTSEKSVDQVLCELKINEIGHAEQETILLIIEKSQTILEGFIGVRKYVPNKIKCELDRIRESKQKYGVDVFSSCLAVTSMALYVCKKYWPLNTQLVSYCLLVIQRTNEKGRLLEILTGEGKSCIIAMVAATYALLGRTVDIVTSSPVLSQRDAEEWREFYSVMELEVGCNVENNTEEDIECYECPIVYGTVETFARDILKTEFLMQDVRWGRKCGIVIVDEIDSMLIDQGVQCTYLGHDVASLGMRHFEPILALIWMHVSKYTPVNSMEGNVLYASEPEVFFVALSRLSNEIDPLQILRLAEQDEECSITEGFTEEYLKKDIEGQQKLLITLNTDCLKSFFLFARKYLRLDMDLYDAPNDGIQQNLNERAQISIWFPVNGLASVVLHKNMIKDRLVKMITYVLSNNMETKIDLPKYLRDYCCSRLRNWIDNAFLATKMQPGREYIVQDDAIYPVDHESSGFIEINKNWGDGLQQFLEMKHSLPRSPLTIITNFLSNIDFFDRYGSNIVGVSGKMGMETYFVSDTFSVEFTTIPTSKRRKIFELAGLILEEEGKWLESIFMKVESAVGSQRAVLVICKDIAIVNNIHKNIPSKTIKATRYLKGDGNDEGRMNKVLTPGDVVITTNLGARGTDFVTDDIVNKNGGLFVLVTFIPLKNRVEDQAFGRTGRRGATGSCQIIVHREAMPERLRSCDTVNEAKRLRDSIEMHRFSNMNEVNSMRNKQELFREYCEFKKRFITSSASESKSNDLKIQEEILDETWAKWIQNYDTIAHKSDHTEVVQNLRKIIEDCAKRAKKFDSDNIYHILKFGAVRLMKGDFEAASKLYDRVIRMDPAWSAFAHYNRAYCTIHMKGGGYIRVVIKDLKCALGNLENYKTNCLFSEIIGGTNARDERNDESDESHNSSTPYYIVIEYQFLHYIETQIIETIDKLDKIEKMRGKVTTVRRNVLELIPSADRRTKHMLHEYRQLGLLFIFNIDTEPQFCYTNQIVSLFVGLKSTACSILRAFSNRVLVNGRSIELKDTIDAVCSMKLPGDESSGWMSRCVSRAIITGINSIDFMSDVSSLFPIKQTELESCFKMTAEASEFTQFVNSQAKYFSKLMRTRMQEMNKFVCWQGAEILLEHTTKVALNVSRGKIVQTILETMATGKELHRELCCLYNNVTSSSLPDFEQFVDCIRDLSKFTATSSHLLDTDFQTAELQRIAVELMSKSRDGSRTAADSVEPYKQEIQTAAERIDIKSATTKFSEFLYHIIKVLNQKSESDDHVCGDDRMLEATNNVLTSALSDIIQGMLQNRIRQSVMVDMQKRTDELFASIKNTLAVEDETLRDYIRSWKSGTAKHFKPLSNLSNRVEKYNNQLKKTRGSHVRQLVEAKILSEDFQRSIVFVDVDKEEILRIWYPENRETAINNVYMTSRRRDHTFIDEHPSVAGRLLTSVDYACLLKRGRALLRLDMNHPARQTNQCESLELDSSHLSSCIEQALESENVSRLAQILARYKSESKSADGNSSEHGTYKMTSPVSRDAYKLFLFSGRSDEAGFYGQLVVERINDDDISTALKLCCIGHQTPFCRDKINSDLQISDYQTLGDTFNQMLKEESYEQEVSEFVSICDEWYRVLEPQELMNIEQRELLTEWISTRQYANTEDSVVSLLLKKYSDKKERSQDELRREGEAMNIDEAETSDQISKPDDPVPNK